MAAQERVKRKIIWAVDPQPGEEVFLKTAADQVKFFSQKLKLPVKLVSVVSEWNKEFALNLARPELWSFEGATQDMLRAIAEKYSVGQEIEPSVIVSSSSSTRESIKALLSYAKRQETELLVCGTHSRKGLARMALGSFAETLVLMSRLPLLLVKPGVPCREKIERILFPTDFSSAAKKNFTRVLGLGRAFGARVDVFHQLEFPINPFIEHTALAASYSEFSMEGFVDAASKRFSKDMEFYKKAGQKAAVGVEVRLESKITAISDSILQYSEKGPADLIAMVNRSGPVSSVLLGSVSRQVIREARVPVWIIHDK